MDGGERRDPERPKRCLRVELMMSATLVVLVVLAIVDVLVGSVP